MDNETAFFGKIVSRPIDPDRDQLGCFYEISCSSPAHPSLSCPKNRRSELYAILHERFQLFHLHPDPAYVFTLQILETLPHAGRPFLVKSGRRSGSTPAALAAKAMNSCTANSKRGFSILIPGIAKPV